MEHSAPLSLTTKKGDHAMKRNLDDLKARSEKALVNPDLVQIARYAPAPTVAYDDALSLLRQKSRDKEEGRDLAKSCRFLAIIRRDYGKDEFEKYVFENKQDAENKEKNVKMETGAIIRDERVVKYGANKERIRSGPEETLWGFKVGDTIRIEKLDIEYGKTAVVLGFQSDITKDLYNSPNSPDNRTFVVQYLYYLFGENGVNHINRVMKPLDISLLKRKSLDTQVGDSVRIYTRPRAIGIAKIINPLTEQFLIHICEDEKQVWEWFDIRSISRTSAPYISQV